MVPARSRLASRGVPALIDPTADGTTAQTSTTIVRAHTYADGAEPAMTNLGSTSDVGRRAPWCNGALLALGVLTCASWALVLLVAFSVVASAFDLVTEGETPGLLLLVWLFAVLAPAGWLGWTRRGAWAWWAAGFPAAFALVLAGELAVPLLTPGPASQAEARLSAIEAGSAPTRIYYLGPSFNDWDLQDAVISPAGSDTTDVGDTSLGPGDLLYVDYGSTCGFLAGGTCGAQLELEIVRADNSLVATGRCKRRLPVVRGGAVPIASGFEIDIFTGDVAVRVEEITWNGLGKKVARALRTVADKRGREPLPKPTSAVMASIDKRCGEIPEGATLH